MKDEMKETVTDIHVRGAVYAKSLTVLVQVTGNTIGK